jgi:DNA invertase Pin-like site-specific DNA recombinase
MIGDQKITPKHLSRRAIVYLRQSSEGQVRNNHESQKLQYALADKARSLGFHEVETIDTDLGSSAAVAAKRREGFERLLGAVAIGEVGLILSRELSRLLRTDRDFCQLVELCQLFGTLIGDDENLYDTSRMDDQLVLGIKATMSVVELKVLQLRLAQGKENKARRGELYPRLPPGYVWNGVGSVAKDPNLRVQEAIALVFAKFWETWSIRQTFKWFRDNDVQLPVSRARGGKLEVEFQVPRHSFVAGVLHNPFYAGAYAWGRRSTGVVWRDGVLRKRQGSATAPEEARVFIREHHEGYLDWSAFEEIQRMIRRNDQRGKSDEKVGAIRAGSGLFSGVLRCGRCGRRIHVRYAGKAGTKARYLCTGDYVSNGNRYCLGFGGSLLDRQLGSEVVRVLSPLGIDASLRAAEQLESRGGERRGALQRQCTQLEYEVTRAFEQYNEVDPRNRLVATELERRWNAKLEELERAQANLAELNARQRPVSVEERQELTAFAEHFAQAWNHPACPIDLKKQIIRSVIEEVVVNEAEPGKLSVIVHWKGGSHTTFALERTDPKRATRTADENLEVIRKMAPRHGDDAVARALNKLGRRTGKGRPWSQLAVKTARRNHGIDGCGRSVEDPDVLSLHGAARHTGTSNTTIVKLVEAGVLPMRQAVPFAPWEIERADLESARVRAILEHLERTGRLALGNTSDAAADQTQLFPTKVERR